MKITKKVWPVAFVGSSGTQINGVWDLHPGTEKYWVGEPVELTFDYPDDLVPKMRAEKIAELEATLETLRGAA